MLEDMAIFENSKLQTQGKLARSLKFQRSQS